MHAVYRRTVPQRYIGIVRIRMESEDDDNCIEKGKCMR
jgi:hypothetical protein